MCSPIIESDLARLMCVCVLVPVVYQKMHFTSTVRTFMQSGDILALLGLGLKVKVRMRGWEVHYLNESPHNHRSTKGCARVRTCMCTWVRACLIGAGHLIVARGFWGWGQDRVRRLEGSFPEPLSW